MNKGVKTISIFLVATLGALFIWRGIVFILTPGWINYHPIKRNERKQP